MSLQESIASAGAVRVDDLLARSAARSPRATALRFEDREFTYADLDAAVTRVAAALISRGLAPGERVAAYGLNSDAYVVLYLACARANLVHVPVNFALKGGELAYLLADSGTRLLAVDPDLATTAQEVLDAGRAPGVEHLWPLTGEDSVLAVATGAADPDPAVVAARRGTGADLAQLLYTSGTTSAPKGAMMTHAALVAEYVSSIIALDQSADDRPLVAMPLYHSAAMHVFLMPYLALGAAVRLLPKPDVPQILRLVQEERIGSLFLAPTVWVPLSNHPDLDATDLSSLTKAQYGASIMPVTVLQRLQARYPDIGFYNCFGQSELGPLCTVLRPEEHEARPASAGRPVFNVLARVVDADGATVGPGESGEIQYRGPQLFSGYWGKDEQTEAAFDDGWFRSGDQVTLDAAGYVTVVDRIKDVINTGGVLVAPREVEDVVYELDGVAEVAVIGLPDPRWIEAVTAVVVLKDGVTLTQEDVIGHVKERLAGFKVPKTVDFVDQLPRNQSGKLLKRELRAERSR